MPIIRLLFNTKFQLAIIILLTVGVYANTIGNQLVWDDKTFASWQQTASFANLPYFLKGNLPGPHQGDYRLFKGIILTFDKVVFGNSLFVFHLQAILIHLSVTFLVFLLTKKILDTMLDAKKVAMVAFLTALLFGVHPVHVEAVTFITSSTDIVGIAFLFLSFYFYVLASGKYQFKKKKLIISGIFALLAFASYEVTFVLPALFVLYDFCFPKLEKEQSKEKFLRYVYFLSILASYAVVRFGILKVREGKSFLEGSFYLTMLAQAKAMLEYVKITVFPLDLTLNHQIGAKIPSLHYVDYNKEAYLLQKITDPAFLTAVGAVVALLVFAIFLYKRMPLITFSVLWFFISLAVVSNLIPLNNFMSERYLYLPSYGFVLLLAYVLVSLYNLSARFLNFRALRLLFRLLTLALAVAIVTFYSARTVIRNRDWSSDYTFWSYEYQKSPNSVLASHNLGNTYFDKGDLKRAIELYEWAEAQNTRNLSVVNLHLGNAYLKDGKPDKALIQFQKTIEENKGEHLAYYGLGAVYLQQKKTDLAIQAYNKTLELNSLYYPAYIDLGSILANNGEWDRAIQKFTIASKIKPKEALPHRNLAGVYKQPNKLALAISAYQIALQLDPENAEVAKQLQEVQIKKNIKENKDEAN